MHVSEDTTYKKDICRFYLQGDCKNGDECKFSHPKDVRGENKEVEEVR